MSKLVLISHQGTTSLPCAHGMAARRSLTIMNTRIWNGSRFNKPVIFQIWHCLRHIETCCAPHLPNQKAFILKSTVKAIFLFVTAFCAVTSYALFFTSYFKRRDCFNSEGRCFDAEFGVVYLEQSGLVWLFLAVLFTGLAVVQIWLWRR